MQWVLDLFDKHKVSTRDVTDRYKAFGTGQGSIFWTGPWTLNGYVEQKLPFRTYLFPNIGGTQKTYFEMGGMEFYTQADETPLRCHDGGGQVALRQQLSVDHGRPRREPAEIDPGPRRLQDRRASVGDPRRLRRRHEHRHGRRDPGARRPGLHHLRGGNFLAKTLETVWAGIAKPEEAMEQIKDQWQRGLDAG